MGEWIMEDVKMFEVSRRAMKAVERSIAHWKGDIVARLQVPGEGVVCEVRANGTHAELYWASDRSIIPCTSNYCPLCRLFVKCDMCPYTLCHGKPCDAIPGGVWMKWWRNPSLKTALAMVRALQKVEKRCVVRTGGEG